MTIRWACLGIFLCAGIAAAEEEMTLRGVVREIDRLYSTFVLTTDDGKDVVFTAEGSALSRIKKRALKVDDDVTVTYVFRDGSPRAISIFRKPSG
jgi:hypothetical protein